MQNARFKFRAWDKKQETMIGVLKMDFLFEDEDGVMVEGYCDCDHGVTQDHENHKHTIFPEDLILMQWTGLKDNDGKLIFEGDIVAVNQTGFEEKRNYKVCWFEDYPAYDLEGWDGESNALCEIDASGEYEIEVIGNIYENPELLKQ